uniref:Uncharacterized protein n=1 Tax=Rhipicephalus zambeziensis TaxID=60191 RepID=A0A224Y7E9_9ACAR
MSLQFSIYLTGAAHRPCNAFVLSWLLFLLIRVWDQNSAGRVKNYTVCGQVSESAFGNVALETPCLFMSLVAIYLLSSDWAGLSALAVNEVNLSQLVPLH